MKAKVVQILHQPVHGKTGGSAIL